MSLRVIGGKFRNHPLFSPKGQQTRPTSGLVRKAIFDMVQADIEEATFLDLFAGSGAMGIEAISRGAAHATFIDSGRLACQCIKKNIDHLHIPKEEATILCGDAESMLARLGKQHQQFQIIYIDPPYNKGLIPTTLQKIDALSLLSSNGRLFAEESADGIQELQALSLIHLKKIQERSYGNSTIVEYRIS